MDILIAALCGIGIAMLWQRGEPIKPVHNWVVIRLNRIHDKLAVRKWPKYPVWWLRGVLSCESCLAPWMALGSGLAMDLGWYAFAALPTSFAIYHLLIQIKEHP